MMPTETIGQIFKFIKAHYPLSALNRIQTGGYAQYYAPVPTINDLKRVIDFCSGRQLPFYVLGKGSNVIISDNDFNGVVIRLVYEFQSIVFDSSRQTVTAGGGAALMQLGHKIAQKGYMGCSYMGVIPGTVGGAVRMNTGTTNEGEISNNFLSALILDPAVCEIQELSKENLTFGYRTSALVKSQKIILQATFNLPTQKKTYQNEALSAIKALLAYRRAKNPANQHTFGSTFKNPKNCIHSAGWLLEKVGMKEMRCGDAMVSAKHANWIVNTGNAKSKEIKKLIEIGQKRVLEKFGIQLEREVIYLPEDMKEWQD